MNDRTTPGEESRPLPLDLEETLRKLPRVVASEGFTERVVAAARHVETERTTWSHLALRAAGLIALLGGAVVAGALFTGQRSADVADDPAGAVVAEVEPAAGPVHSRVLDGLGSSVPVSRAEELQMLRVRFRSLQAELDELQQLASRADPVVDLGSGELSVNDEPVDYFLDLRALLPADGRTVRASLDR